MAPPRPLGYVDLDAAMHMLSLPSGAGAWTPLFASPECCNKPVALAPHGLNDSASWALEFALNDRQEEQP